MHIFVDESGSFLRPHDPRPNMCCVATLAVPESNIERLHALHARLVADWNPAEGELKGRTLSERNFHRILTELGNLDVVLTIVAIDMRLQPDARVTAHRLRQATMLRESVAGDEYLPSFRKGVHALAARTEALSNQLYVQSFLQTEAIARTLRITTMHYAQTEPRTLASFVWQVDAKDRTVQECERLWVDLVKPVLQTIFLERPLVYVEGDGFDYSAMDQFHNPDQDEPPPYLAGARTTKGPFKSSDLRPLVRDLSFRDSRSSPGIQFADVLASAFCRACNGRLGERGWRHLGRLMIQHPLDHKAVEYVSLSPVTISGRPGGLSYGTIVRRIEAEARDFYARGR